MTKMDVWGLVINEAMMYSLPVITTDKCGAGAELVRNNENGYIIHVGDDNQLVEKSNYILSDSMITKRFGEKSYSIIKNYSIENMAETHIKMFEKIEKSDS